MRSRNLQKRPAQKTVSIALPIDAYESIKSRARDSDLPVEEIMRRAYILASRYRRLTDPRLRPQHPTEGTRRYQFSSASGFIEIVASATLRDDEGAWVRDESRIVTVSKFDDVAPAILSLVRGYWPEAGGNDIHYGKNGLDWDGSRGDLVWTAAAEICGIARVRR